MANEGVGQAVGFGHAIFFVLTWTPLRLLDMSTRYQRRELCTMYWRRRWFASEGGGLKRGVGSERGLGFARGSGWWR